MEIRVCIFEDNKLVRNAMEAILNGTSGYLCVGAFADGNRWELDIKRCMPEVVLMDIEMPGLNGITITRGIRDKFPSVKILIQTVFDDRDKIFLALTAGASGYILKNNPPHYQLEAIAEVFNGGASVSPAIAKKILDFFTKKNVILIIPEETDFQLSQREKEILHLMIDGRDFKSIAEEIFISYETVRTHVKHIYKKLHVAGRSDAVRKAIEQGLR